MDKQLFRAIKICSLFFMAFGCQTKGGKHNNSASNNNLTDYGPYVKYEDDTVDLKCKKHMLSLFLKGEYDSVITISRLNAFCHSSDFAAGMYYLALSEKYQKPFIDSLFLRYSKTTNLDSIELRLYPQAVLNKMGPYALHALVIFDRLKHYKLDRIYADLDYQVSMKRQFESDTLFLYLEKSLLNENDEGFDSIIQSYIKKYPKWKYLKFLDEFRNEKIDGKTEIDLNE